MKMANWFRTHRRIARHAGRRALSGLLALVMTLGLAEVALPGVRAKAEDGVAQTNFYVTHYYLGDPVLTESGWVAADGSHNYIYTVEHDATPPTISYYSEDTDTYYIYPQPQTYLDESVGAPVTEEYSGYEILDGNKAVTWVEPTGDGTERNAGHFEIKYNAEVQTVRLYLFYSYNGMTVLGASFGAVLTGLDGVDVAGKDVLEVTDANREAIINAIRTKNPDALNDVDPNTVERIYNTDVGLHTEKRVSPDVLEDGRTFDVSLESWYTASSNRANVGFILDSSGSMAFVPTDAIDAFERGDDKEYGTTVWDKGYGPYVSLPATCWTNPNWVFSGNTDNSPLAYTNYSYYVYDSRDSVNELVPLAYWDGKMAEEDNPLLAGLVGLYQFARDDSADPKDPDFLKNGAPGGGEATPVEASHNKTGGDYKKDTNSTADSVTPTAGAFQAYDEGNKAHSILDLDAVVPDPNNFTLSFAVKTNGTGVINEKYSSSSGTGTGPQAEDLVTIKNAATDEVLYTILRGTRSAGNSQDHVRWVGSDSTSVDVKKVFSASGDSKASYGKYTANSWLVFTFVVQDGHVTTYVDGTKATYTDGGKNTAEGDVTFDGATSLKFTLGGSDEFVSGPTLQIDEVYIYNRALSEDDGEIAKLVDTMKDATGSVLKKEGEEHALIGGNIMDLNQASQFVALPQEKRAGWYYVNSTSDYGTISKTGSAKSLHGLTPGSTSKPNKYPDNMGVKDDESGKNVLYEPYSLDGCNHENSDDSGYYTYEESHCDTVPGKTVALTAGEKITTASPCILYFGRATPDDYAKGFVGQKEGESGELILRCVFSPTGGDVQDSPVLFKADHNAAHTKVQKLQIALNKFINRLQVDSPDSKVSAVRFSSDQYVKDDVAGTDLEKELLLQTWTSDPTESTGMMSLNRGTTDTGMAKATDEDGGLYNYVITGGTNAFTGLQAFTDYLAEAEEIKDDEASKYIILFTDGQDNELTTEDGSEIEDVKTTKAVELAKKLRENYDYTIFTVQLVSGDKASSEDPKIPEFLAAIAGEGGKCFKATSADALDEAFDSIIEELPFRLTGYTVRDYIDPRFDLVADTKTPTTGDAGVRTREIVHLHEGGTIHIGESDEASEHYDLTKDDGHEFYFSTAEKNDTEGAEGEATYTERYTKATLKYDEAKGLYYLEWTNQSIPLCQEGSNRLSVWSAVITLRAKEDFIGGNAVLTNGPSADENMVFHPDDEAPSSGTDRAGADVPSKGFPRTQVNVKPYRMVTDPTVDVRYLGESLDPEEALSTLLHNAEGEIRDLDHLNVTREEWDNRDGSGYYYEYVQRYINKHKDDVDAKYKDFDAFLDDLLAGNPVELPYSFLPAVTGGGEHDHSTQTGGTAYEDDVLGTIAYQWAAVTDDDGPLDDDLTADPIANTAPKRYQLTVSYAPNDVSTREPVEATLIDDEAEAYKIPKAPVGTPAVDDSAQALHTTYVVSGRLSLKAQAPTTTLEQIVKDGGALNVTVERNDDPAASIAAVKAGDLPFRLTQEALDAAPEINGARTVYFTADDTLPMGSYTLGLTEPEPGDFTDLKGADDDDYTWDRFGLEVDGVTVDSYFAGRASDTNTVTFQLGDTNDEARASARAGLAEELAKWVDGKITAAIDAAPDEDAKRELRTSQEKLNGLDLDPTWDSAANLPAYLNDRLGMGEVYMTLTPPVEVILTTEKTLQNAALNDQPVSFTFTLTPEGGVDPVQTATVNYGPLASRETRPIAFYPLVFTRPGIYTYTLAETAPGLGRFAFDENKYKVRITVSDSGVTVTVDGTPYKETQTDSGNQYTFNLAPDDIAFTNIFNPPMGKLTIHKVVDGDGVPTPDATYVFEVNSDPVRIVTIEGNGSRELDLEPGTYTVTERTTGENFTTTVDGVPGKTTEVDVPLDGSAEVTFTNTYEKVEPPAPTTGKLTIRKVVVGDGAPTSDETYTFEVNSDPVQTVTIQGSGSAELDLAPGTYTVTELTSGESFTTTVDGVPGKAAEVTVSAGGSTEVTFTNTYKQTEPPAPTTGKLTIRKAVVNSPTPEETYTFEVSDGSDSQTVTIEGSGSVELRLAPGTYTVTELTSGESFTTTVDGAPGKAAEVTVPAGGSAEVTFTNTYEQTEPPAPTTGKLTIRKVVAGDGQPTSAETYTFAINTDPVRTVTIQGSGSRELDLEPGTYTVTELTSGESFTTTVDGVAGKTTEVTVPAGGSAEVTFTNTYEQTEPPTPTTGKLTIRKVVAGDGQPTPAETYTFAINTDPVRTVTIQGSGSRELDLEPGTYTVTELTSGESFTTTVDGTPGKAAEVTVPTGGTAEVTFTNTYKQTEPPAPTTGKLTIRKVVVNPPTPEETYTFEVNTDPVQTVTIQGSGSRELDLALGTYTVTELTSGANFTTTVDGVPGKAAEVTVSVGGTAEVIFTNTYEKITPTVGDLTISKTVTGSAGDRSREWHFHLALGDQSIDGVYGDMTLSGGEADLTLTHGQSVTLTGLPAGVTYTVTEAEAGQDGYKTTSTGATGAIPHDGAASAAFVNAKPAVATGSSGQTAPHASNETPAPSETPTPSETPAPEETPTPSETPTPEETPVPSGPPASSETPAPGETPAPEEPPAPSETPVPEEPPTPDETPKTGDDSHLGLWVALLLLGAAGTAVALWPTPWHGKGRRGRK